MWQNFSPPLASVSLFIEWRAKLPPPHRSSMKINEKIIVKHWGSEAFSSNDSLWTPWIMRVGSPHIWTYFNGVVNVQGNLWLNRAYFITNSKKNQEQLVIHPWNVWEWKGDEERMAGNLPLVYPWTEAIPACRFLGILITLTSPRATATCGVSAV